MDKLTSEAVAVLAYLLPGFVATAVFYSLTPLPKPDAFNRIVHALIFTALSHATLQALIQFCGLSPQSQHSIVWSVPIAVLLAVLVVLALNHDAVHRVLRKLRVTKETGYPSEWFSTFARHSNQYIVLHLRGDRRLYGWVEEWPSDPKSGHFRIGEYEWLSRDGASLAVPDVEVILIPNSEVEMVEFMPNVNPTDRKA